MGGHQLSAVAPGDFHPRPLTITLLSRTICPPRLCSSSRNDLGRRRGREKGPQWGWPRGWLAGRGHVGGCTDDDDDECAVLRARVYLWRENRQRDDFRDREQPSWRLAGRIKRWRVSPGFRGCTRVPRNGNAWRWKREREREEERRR